MSGNLGRICGFGEREIKNLGEEPGSFFCLLLDINNLNQSQQRKSQRKSLQAPYSTGCPFETI